MTCDAIVTQRPTRWGFEGVRCTQVVGIRTYVTTGGLRVGYCSIGGHEQNVRRRFAEQQDPLEPSWLHEELAHESHESTDYECRLCLAELDESAALAGRMPFMYSRDELAEIAADRELVRDEHLDAMTYAKWFAEVYDHADPH